MSESTFQSRAVELRAAVREGLFSVAFTSDLAREGVQLHPLADVAALEEATKAAEAAERIILGVVALTLSGPRIVLTEPLTSGEVDVFVAATLVHFNERFTAAVGRLGVAVSQPQPIVH